MTFLVIAAEGFVTFPVAVKIERLGLAGPGRSFVFAASDTVNVGQRFSV
jgi:hypothetical protein